MTSTQNSLSLTETREDYPPPPVPIRMTGRLWAADVLGRTKAGTEEKNMRPCGNRLVLFVGIDETQFSTPRKSWWWKSLWW